MANDIVLVEYDKACRQLARAASVDEVLKIRDKAERIRAYAKQANDKQLEARMLGTFGREQSVSSASKWPKGRMSALPLVGQKKGFLKTHFQP